MTGLLVTGPIRSPTGREYVPSPSQVNTIKAASMATPYFAAGEPLILGWLEFESVSESVLPYSFSPLHLSATGALAIKCDQLLYHCQSSLEYSHLVTNSFHSCAGFLWVPLVYSAAREPSPSWRRRGLR